jgi:hypothetical protein
MKPRRSASVLTRLLRFVPTTKPSKSPWSSTSHLFWLVLTSNSSMLTVSFH